MKPTTRIYVEETQRRLLNSDLFSSVLISHGEELDAAGELPLKMRITEGQAQTNQHREASTPRSTGPGVVFAWTNRNVRGMGETLSLDGDFSRRYLAGETHLQKTRFFKA